MLSSAMVTVLSLFLRIDYLTLLLAILGWIAALWLQRSNAKHEHRIQVRYEIYKLLIKGGEKTHAQLHKLGANSPPLILMSTSMIPFDLKLKKEHKGVWIQYSEQECVHEGAEKWRTFVNELIEKYFAFTNQYLEMLYAFEGWEAAIESLIPAQKVLYQEVEDLNRKIYADISKLQTYTTTHGFDWRKWDKKDVEDISASIRDNSSTISNYIADFMALIHNELLSEHFKYHKPIRKTLDAKYKVLTSEGLIVRLEDDHERKLAEILDKTKKSF